jgi:hypothetical protein
LPLDGAYCFFDSATWTGRLTNNFCFQLPLLITIAANTRAFVLGLRALRNSPHSVDNPSFVFYLPLIIPQIPLQVIAREMDRVGKYLIVLLIIWIPNLLVNFYQEIYGSSHTKYEVLVEVQAFFLFH